MNDALNIYNCDNRASLPASRLRVLAELVRMFGRDSWVCYQSRFESLPRRYIGVPSAGLNQAQRIDSSFTADWLSCFWPGVNGLFGAIEDGRNVTIQAVCQPLASGSESLADLVRAQARDYECAISPGFSVSSARYLKTGCLRCHVV